MALDFYRWTVKAGEALQSAQSLAGEYNHQEINVEHCSWRVCVRTKARHAAVAKTRSEYDANAARSEQELRVVPRSGRRSGRTFEYSIGRCQPRRAGWRSGAADKAMRDLKTSIFRPSICWSA
jgi:ATP-dependent Clp protease ATP-binding subunit ClpA